MKSALLPLYQHILGIYYHWEYKHSSNIVHLSLKKKKKTTQAKCQRLLFEQFFLRMFLDIDCNNEPQKQ